MSARTTRIEVLHELSTVRREAVYAFVADVQRRIGHRPLSDHLWLDLVHGGASWRAALIALEHDVDEAAEADNKLLAYAQLSSGPAMPRSWTIELVLDPELAKRTTDAYAVAADVLAAARTVVAAAGGGSIHWWVFDSSSDADVLAASVGLVPARTLYQMRVPLPIEPVTNVPTRAFETGRDEQAWLEVNNTAFAEHAEQGSWDLATLQLREREDWFDPQGFLLHERDARLAAFCWTKIHHDTDPVLGEIYVIAVHPDFHGLGLGRALTIAGLSSLAARGVTTGMLHVDHHNTAAVGLYRSLGFNVHRTDRAYVGNIPAKEQP